MPSSNDYRSYRAGPIQTGWVQTGERWALWYNGRETAGISPEGKSGLRLWMKGQKMWLVKESRVGSLRQGKRFAERWYAARLYPGLPLLEAVARLTEGTPNEPSPTIPRSSITAEQQQADRLHAAALTASARVLEALAPVRPLLRTDP